MAAHCEDEKPVDCKMEKPALEKPLAGEEVDVKIINEAKEEEKEPKEKWTNKFILYGTNKAGDVIVQKDYTLAKGGKIRDVKDFRDQILNDNDEVIDVFVSRINLDGEEKPLDSYTITRPGHEFDGIDDFEESYFDSHMIFHETK